jgi:hypothetical protein
MLSVTEQMKAVRQERLEVNAALRNIDFPYNPGSLENVLQFFLEQFPEVQSRFENPILLAHFADKFGKKHTYIISAGPVSNRQTMIVVGKRLHESNVPRAHVNFNVNLVDVLYQAMVVGKQQRKLYELLVHNLESFGKSQDSLPESFWLNLAEYLSKSYPDTLNLISINQLMQYLKLIPRTSTGFEESLRTDAPQEYIKMGFRDKP